MVTAAAAGEALARNASASPAGRVSFLTRCLMSSPLCVLGVSDPEPTLTPDTPAAQPSPPVTSEDAHDWGRRGAGWPAALLVVSGPGGVPRLSRRRVGAASAWGVGAVRAAHPRGVPVGALLADDPPEARQLPEGLRRLRHRAGRGLWGLRRRAATGR